MPYIHQSENHTNDHRKQQRQQCQQQSLAERAKQHTAVNFNNTHQSLSSPFSLLVPENASYTVKASHTGVFTVQEAAAYSAAAFPSPELFY